jgi:tetratricopeptide (TPR) repeat protein
MDIRSTRDIRRLAIGVLTAALAAGCATEPPPAPKAVEPPPVQAPAPAPAAPLVPELPPVQAKAEAQKLALQGVDLLQSGDEAGARGVLEKALAYDGTNELAKKLMDQIKADAQTELGATFFRYTVQRDDSLSKIAQAYMGDRFKFYILAKYNDIANPSKLAAGQVIKVPGKQPAVMPATARPAPTPAPVPAPATTTAEPAPAPAPAAEPEPSKAASPLMQQGMAQQKSGNLEAAYASFSDAVKVEPNNKEAVMQRDAVKVALVRKYEREALQANQRQNLDLAIKKWDQIIALDPNNQRAKLERERALELKRRMTEKFGSGGSPPASATAK